MDISPSNYLIEPGTSPALSAFDASDTGSYSRGARGKELALKHLKSQRRRLRALQNLLYAAGSRSLLVVLQALDAGGKDGTIRRVMSGMNPQGVRVTSFKAPTPIELSHDFLWRISKPLPAKGMIAVFNRSHYEDVLVARVKKLVPKNVWSQRYDMINSFEKRLIASGTAIVKIYLNISRAEQKSRFQDRLDNPKKRWKFNPEDLSVRDDWDEYQTAYEQVFSHCSTEAAPWYIVPANRKWYRNVVVAAIMIEALEKMKLKYPTPSFDHKHVVIGD